MAAVSSPHPRKQQERPKSATRPTSSVAIAPASRNLSFCDFDLDTIRLQLVCCAQTMTFAAQARLLDDNLAGCKPERPALPAAVHRRHLAVHARTAPLKLTRS